MTQTRASAASPVPAYGDDIQPQPVVIAQGSADAPLGRPLHYGPSSGPHANLYQAPIVDTGHRALPPVFKPTVTQLASGGPFVAASGSAAVAAGAHARLPADPRLPVRSAPTAFALGQGLPRPAPPPAGVSVPLVGVFLGGEPSARHAGAKSSLGLDQPVGPAGLASTRTSQLGTSGPVEVPGGASMLFGNAPPSSSGGSSAPLLGLNAMLAAMTLLAGIAWRRRSWELPVLRGESALLSTALDRPG